MEEKKKKFTILQRSSQKTKGTHEYRGSQASIVPVFKELHIQKRLLDVFITLNSCYGSGGRLYFAV